MTPRRFGLLAAVAGALACGCAGTQAPSTPSTSHKNPSATSIHAIRPGARLIDGQCVDKPASGNDSDEFQSRAVGPLQRVNDLGVQVLSFDALVDLDQPSRVLAYHLSQAVEAAASLAFSQTSTHGSEVWQTLQWFRHHRDDIPPSLRPRIDTMLRTYAMHGGTSDRWTGAALASTVGPQDLRDAWKAITNAQLQAAPTNPASPASRPDPLPEPILQRVENAMLHGTPAQPLVWSTRCAPPINPPGRSDTITLASHCSAQASDRALLITPASKALSISVALANPAQQPAISALQKYLTVGSAADLTELTRALAQPNTNPFAVIGPFASAATHPQWFAATMLADTAGLQPVLDALSRTPLHLGTALDTLASTRAKSPMRPRPSRAVLMTAPIPLDPDSAVVTVASFSDNALTLIDSSALDVVASLLGPSIRDNLPPGRARDIPSQCLHQVFRVRRLLQHVVGKAATDAVIEAHSPHGADQRAASQQLDTLAQAAELVLASIAMWDPQLEAIGLLEGPCKFATVPLFLAEYLVSLRSLSASAAWSSVKDPNLRATTLIVHAALADGAIKQQGQGADSYFVMENATKWRAFAEAFAGKLLTAVDEVSRRAKQKATGTTTGPLQSALVRRFGHEPAPAWVEAGRKRAGSRGLPTRLLLVTQGVRALRDEAGMVVDATVEDDM